MFSCTGLLADALQTWEAKGLPLEGVLPPLVTAALNDNRVDVVALIRAGADVDVGEVSGGCTPLLVAVHNGNAAVVLTLLRAGADVDKARDDGTTPLIIAAMKGHTAVVMALLGAGADLRKVGVGGFAIYLGALEFAAHNGHDAVVAAIIEAGLLEMEDIKKLCAEPMLLLRHAAMMRWCPCV